MLHLFLSLAIAAEPEDGFDAEIVVVGDEPPGTRPLDSEHGNLARAAGDVPGVAIAVRGGNTGEIVVRGMSWERVPVRVGGVPVLGACPSRMDPPAAVIPADAIGSASLSLGLPSVTHGPLGTGGGVEASPYLERTGARPPSAWAGTRFDSARMGLYVDAGAEVATDTVGARATVGMGGQGDYRAADGTEVPSSRSWRHGSLALDVTPSSVVRWSTGLVVTDDRDTDFPSLPMDERRSRLLLGATRLTLRPAGDLVDAVTVRGGTAIVNHVMDNADKPNRQVMVASTESRAITTNAALEVALSPSSAVSVVAGVDANLVARDALRTRELVETETTFEDALWPSVRQDDLGLFAEARVRASRRLELTVGGRADLVTSRADGDAAGLGGASVADQYARFYGADAAEVDDTQLAGGGSVVGLIHLGDRAVAFAGVGFAARAAQATERYFAFAPAPGGFNVGNPTLPTEKLVELEIGTRLQGTVADLRLSAWWHEVADYVMPSLLLVDDINGDGVDDIVRGYFPVDARLLGFEVGATPHLGSHVDLPAKASFVYGQDRTNAAPLPEIAPIEGTVDARATWGRSTPWWVRAGARLVAAQPRVAERFPEDRTDAFATVHATAGIAILETLTLEVRGENLTNTLYNEHLTREAALPTGDLEQGDEIPAPGRSVFATLRAEI